ncbi:hypothetical protein Q1W71_20725 [Flavobacterium pectinovorum]|uniref:hypothetical protein n=1 Tax=Flavobacterium pectinovorum TaxID=29533 RepID=UPI00265ED478|nr:hypothetical protein [Flavobacterium pectinovorum]WKL47373.1 hypothetical protein Q1W71_20725 [Flavobacterium pectinovorum]
MKLIWFSISKTSYTFTDAKAKYLTANQVLIYEKENDFKMGLEGYFTDEQFLYNGIQNSRLLGIWIYS